MVPLGIETTPLVAYDQGFMIMEMEPMDILKKTLKMFLELLLCHVCTMHEDEALALALDAYDENLTLGSLNKSLEPFWFVQWSLIPFEGVEILHLDPQVLMVVLMYIYLAWMSC